MQQGFVHLKDGYFLIIFDYDARVVNGVRELAGRKFNPATKEWKVPSAQAEAVEEFAVNFGFHVTNEANLAFSAAKEARLKTTVNTVPVRDLTGMFGSRRLYAHQKSAVKFLVENPKAILADDMGLGKTLAALVAASHYDLPIYVVCPASLKENWLREAAACGVAIADVFSWAKIPEPSDLPADYCLIADEAHYAQGGWNTKRGKAFLALNNSAKVGYLLSGTPMKNGKPVNLLPLLVAIGHPVARNIRHYQQRYCDAKQTRWSRWDVSGASHLDELHQRVKDRMLRRTKLECLDLPEKTRVMREAELTDSSIETYERVFSEFKKRWQERVLQGKVLGEAEVLAMLNGLRQACSQGKLETAVELAADIVEGGNSVVLYTAYVNSAQELSKRLGGLLLTGDTPVAQRQELVDAFQAGKNKVICCTFGAGGIGLTLTRAQDVILVDRPWTPGDTVQAEDRLHRIGQRNAVTCYWIQWPLGDLDRSIDDMLDQKQERVELVMAGKRRTLRGTTTANQIARAVAAKIFA